MIQIHIIILEIQVRERAQHLGRNLLISLRTTDYTKEFLFFYHIYMKLKNKSELLDL